MPASTPSDEISLVVLLGFGFGALFLLLLFGVAVYIMVTGQQVPDFAMFLFRVILALAAAGAAAIFTGFIDIQVDLPKVVIQAGGALAVFAIIYVLNPPRIVQDAIPTPGRVIRHDIKRNGKG